MAVGAAEDGGSDISNFCFNGLGKAKSGGMGY